jgi:hypothetical protein
MKTEQRLYRWKNGLHFSISPLRLSRVGAAGLIKGKYRFRSIYLEIFIAALYMAAHKEKRPNIAGSANNSLATSAIRTQKMLIC